MYLIIPDIHEKYKKMMRILEKYESKVEKIIFLGDYFDSFGETFSEFENMVTFIDDKISKPNYIFLYGNHDLHYLYNHRWLQCSGFEYEKKKYLEEYRKDFICKFKPIHVEDNFIFSHAGLCERFIHPQVGPSDLELYVTEKCIYALNSGHSDPILMPSYVRGGQQAVGGITWCDFSEFEPVEGYYQIFGHTCKKQYRMAGDENYCIDTDLKHIALVNIKEKEIDIQYVGDV